MEGQANALADYGYNRDGKRGELQIVLGVLADNTGQPPAVRVFTGHPSDPAMVAQPIRIKRSSGWRNWSLWATREG